MCRRRLSLIWPGTADWHKSGLRGDRGVRRDKRSLNKITAILDRYEPDLLILQDTSPNGTRRIQRLARLNGTIESAGQERRIPVFRYSRDEVYGSLRAFGVANKQQLAQLVAK